MRLSTRLSGLPILSLSIWLLAPQPAVAAEEAVHAEEPANSEAPADTEAGGSAQLPEGLTPPQLENQVSLEYPAELLQSENPPGGKVLLKYVVGIDGLPKDIEVLQSVHPAIDQAAIQAVAELRYRAATYQGQAVEMVLSIALEIQAPSPLPTEPEPASEGVPESTDEGEEPSETSSASSPEERPLAGPIRIRGQLLKAGERVPVGGSTVTALPASDLALGRLKDRKFQEPREPEWSVEAYSAEDGSFELAGIPDGKVLLVFDTPGFERLRYVLELEPNEQLEARYYQTPLSVNPYRTEVVTEREVMEEVTRHSISVEELSKIPGTQGDALKAIQNFPGIARAPFGSGGLTIRGASPEDSAIYLGYHEIPNLYHFGGLTSVFNADILQQIDYLPGNFDSRYGDALGGVVNVVPRKGRRDGYHGYIDSDLFDTGVLLEGKVGKGSFVLSGRRSYIDLLLPLVINEDAGFSFTVAPRYWDYQALFDYPVSKGEFSARVFGSDDRTVITLGSPNDLEEDERDGFETTQYFHRADLVYRKRQGPWEFLLTPSYKHDFAEFKASDFFSFNITANTLSSRSEISRNLSKRARWRIGAETVSTWYDLDISAPPLPGTNNGDPDGGASIRRVEDSLHNLALYSTLTLGLSDRFTLYPGVRVNYYAAPLHRSTTDPRLRFTWDLAENTTLKGGVGLYSQGPLPAELDTVFGNPRLGPEHALHTSLGIAQQLPADFRLELTGFYKNLWSVITPSTDITTDDEGIPQAEIVANQGFGRVYGAEFLLRKEPKRKLFGWVSYTLMRSERQAKAGEPWRLDAFDQTHILTIISSYKLPRHWQIGARFRLVSGNPSTPTTDGVFNANDGGYIALIGPENSDRLPLFHQLDFRVDKRWIYRKLSFNLYLDIQNVYNAKNVEFLRYSYDYRSFSTINSLPIIPSIGLKLEF